MEQGLDLHTTLAISLWTDDQIALKTRASVCKCSCAPDIIAVYGGLLSQWSTISPAVTSKVNILQSMCKSDVIKSVSVSISDSSSVQCASNTLLIQINTSEAVPPGSLVIIYGLNAKASYGTVQVRPYPVSLLSSFRFTEAYCPKYCLPSKLCQDATNCDGPNSGPRSSRCTEWCDSDAVLELETRESFTNCTISVMVDNACAPVQPRPSISLVINGPSYHVPKTPVISATPVLSFQEPPTFNDLTVSEDRSDSLDSGTWRGNAFGQRNTLNFSFRPNLDVYTGANITLTGIMGTNLRGPAPTIRNLATFLTTLSVENWDATSGRVLLRVTGLNLSPVMLAGKAYSFGLELWMPLDIGTNSPVQSSVVSLEASGLGPRRACCCVAVQQNVLSPSRFLIPVQSRLPFFPLRSIGQSSCYPGECNTVSVTIVVNRAISSPRDNMYILISGFTGLDTGESCTPSCDIAASRVPLEDVEPGNYSV